jgi:glutathionylspermidine synthase
MQRIAIQPRKDWIQKIEAQGFLFYNLDNYYDETAAYAFSAAEINAIETATVQIQDMCLEAVAHVIKNKLWSRFFIPPYYASFIEKSWNEDACSFYGRLDLAFNDGSIKLLEFNADTPTGLLEASVIQWYWLQEYNKSFDQFNSIHEKLVSHMGICKSYFPANTLHFAAVRDHTEDFMTVKYLEDCAVQAGLQTDFLYIDELSLNPDNRFCDPEGKPIDSIFKLYPWEWLFHEEFGQYLPLRNNAEVNWVEPPWKAILSNKMLLVLLHELFPDSPYILPARFNQELPGSYVRKPVFSREGANVTIVRNGVTMDETGGDYGQEGFIYQQYTELPRFSGAVPIIGSWLIGGAPAGMGIRESSGLITNNTSRFVPHYFI